MKGNLAMKKFMTAICVLLLCGTAFARPTYVFQPQWNQPNNNDVNNGATGQPYTQTQIEAFLNNAKDRRSGAPLASQILDSCGVVEVEKGCHQATDPHITIWVDNRVKSNQVKACQKLNPGTAVHANGC